MMRVNLTLSSKVFNQNLFARTQSRSTSSTPGHKKCSNNQRHGDDASQLGNLSTGFPHGAPQAGTLLGQTGIVALLPRKQPKNLQFVSKFPASTESGADALVSRSILDPVALGLIGPYLQPRRQISTQTSSDDSGKPKDDESSFVRRASVTKKTNYKIDIQRVMEAEKGIDTEEWITANDHRIHAWSISGVESCIVAEIGGTCLAFDMGYATRPSIKCAHVFISHGHVDHVAAIVKHAAHRSLFSLKPPTYYVPPHMVAPLGRLVESMRELHGGDDNFPLKIQPIAPLETIQLRDGLSVQAFPTVHRVPSQGYLVYRSRRTLLPEYQGLPGPEVGQLVREGVCVHQTVVTPELAYTGDTKFELFLKPPIDDLLRVRTLITEATYIDDETDRQGHSGVLRAQLRGHAHLRELVDNEQLLAQVGHIVLVHFSDKYSVRYIRKRVDELLSEQLKGKVSLGVVMKQTFG